MSLRGVERAKRERCDEAISLISTQTMQNKYYALSNGIASVAIAPSQRQCNLYFL